MRSREEVTFVGRMLFELVPSGSLAEQEARLHTQHGPLGCATKSSCLRAREEEQDMPKTPLGVLGMIAEPTGTDGHRAIGRTWHASRWKSSSLAEAICLSTWNTLPLPHPEMIRSLLPLTIRCWYLRLTTLKPYLILAGRSRPRNGEPC
jgi:hypothetical protein